MIIIDDFKSLSESKLIEINDDYYESIVAKDDEFVVYKIEWNNDEFRNSKPRRWQNMKVWWVELLGWLYSFGRILFSNSITNNIIDQFVIMVNKVSNS